MSEDPRCCGSGMCIIDAEGQCWCGQRWNGERMCAAPLAPLAAAPQSPQSAAGIGSAGVDTPAHTHTHGPA